MKLLWSVIMLSAISGEVFGGPKETPPQGPPPKPAQRHGGDDRALWRGAQGRCAFM
jgi:hypothetical protein